MITDAQLDAIWEEIVKRRREKDEAESLRYALDLTLDMNRRALLLALDWEGSKSNTKRLRNKVRLHVIGGSITSDDLWHAINCAKVNKHGFVS